VDDVAYVTGVEPPHPEIYFSYRQMNGRLKLPAVTLLLPPGGDTAALVAAVRMAVGRTDARLVPEGVMRIEDRILGALARPRLYAILLGAFASAALLIAAVGLVGVLSYVVAQRSRELALRAALGAQPRDLLRLVLRQGMTATSIGIIAGLGFAVAIIRSIRALLYGVTPYDRLTFVAVPVAVLLVAAAACAVPALRAARLHPLDALRS
jgi:putative ABC transport system permease protein